MNNNYRHHLNFKRILVLLLTIFVVTMAVSTDAFADPKKAKKLAQEASKAYSNNDYEVALEKFSAAYAEDANPALLYNMGRVYEAKADFQNAIEQYTLFVTSADVDQDARSDAMERIKTLKDVMELKNGMGKSGGSKKSPSKSKNSASNAAMPAGGCIDINTASAEQLDILNGVGPATAKNIITTRESKGAFKNYNDILDVPKIGEKTLQKFQSQLCPLDGGSGAAPAKAAPANAAPANAAPANTAPAKAAPAKKPVEASEKAILDI